MALNPADFEVVDDPSEFEEVPTTIAPKPAAPSFFQSLKKNAGLEEATLNPISNIKLGFRKSGEGYDEARQASQGAGPGMVAAANEIIPAFVPGVGNEVIPEAVGEAIDPVISRFAGLGGLAKPLIQFAAGPLGMADRGVRGLGARIYHEAAGTPLNAERDASVSRYIMEGEPSAEVSDFKPIDTPSVTGNILTQLGTDFGNNAIANLALAKAGTGLERNGFSRSPKITVGETPNAAVDLLQSGIKPSATSRLGQEFEVGAGKEYLRLAAPETATMKGPAHEVAITAGENVLGKLGTEQADMLSWAKENGRTHISPEAIKTAYSRLAQEPYFKYVDPEALQKFRKMFSAGKPIPIDDAQAVLSDINARQRLARQRTGDSGDSAEAGDRYKANESLAHAIRDQLNEMVSRRTNEFKENYRSYGDVAQVTDQLIKSKAQYRASRAPIKEIVKDAIIKGAAGAGLGSIGAGLGIGTAVGALGGAGYAIAEGLLGRNRIPNRIGKSLQMARGMNIEPPPPMAPQRPSIIPRTKAPGLQINEPELMEIFQNKQRNPVLRDEYIEGLMADNLIENATPKAVPVAPIPEPPFQHESIPMTLPDMSVPPVENLKVAGGMVAEAAPVQAVPTWIENVQRTTHPKINQYRDAIAIEKLVSGKSKITPAEFVADPEVSDWAKNVVRRLAENPESATQNIQLLKEAIESNVNPFKQRQ